jgi:hypothetical protein
LSDVFERIEAKRTLRPAMNLHVRLPVAGQARRRQLRFSHGPLWNSAVRAIELKNVAVHPHSPPKSFALLSARAPGPVMGFIILKRSWRHKVHLETFSPPGYDAFHPSFP